jgi:hypothetical protein
MAMCWICKAEEGTTGEHMSKRSDLKAVFGGAGPLYLHSDRQRCNKAGRRTGLVRRGLE